ncbi:MAG: hypothetical protein K6F29_05745 [Bacteroidales bacterium]|nr:hypothetical protein [Bacteroidales bacterium]
MINTIISALAGILGTIIGVLSTHFIHFIDRKSEERKIVNESIHYLLEVYFLVNRIDMDKIKIEIFDYYFKKYKHGVDENLKETEREQFFLLINPSLAVITHHSYKELDHLGKLYEKMIAKLATVLPVNAYYLRGKNNLRNLIQIVSKYFESINVTSINTGNIEDIKVITSNLQSFFTAILINDCKNDLKVELYELLKMTNRYNRYKGKKVIKRLESKILTEEDKRMVDLLVRGVTNLVNTNTNQH